MWRSYSARNMMPGLTAAARRAGIQLATIVTSIKTDVPEPSGYFRAFVALVNRNAENSYRVVTTARKKTLYFEEHIIAAPLCGVER